RPAGPGWPAGRPPRPGPAGSAPRRPGGSRDRRVPGPSGAARRRPRRHRQAGPPGAGGAHGPGKAWIDGTKELDSGSPGSAAGADEARGWPPPWEAPGASTHPEYTFGGRAGKDGGGALEPGRLAPFRAPVAVGLGRVAVSGRRLLHRPLGLPEAQELVEHLGGQVDEPVVE